MRIEGGNSDTGFLDPEERRHGHVRQPNALFDLGLRQQRWKVLDGDVRRHEHNLQRASDDHHARFFRVSEVRQQFRMARVMTPGHIDGFFIDRPGDHPVDTACLGQVHGCLDKGHRCRTGFRRRHARLVASERPLERIQHGNLSGSPPHGFMSLDHAH